jgi:outer membrane lipoprotein-sorting protein
MQLSPWFLRALLLILVGWSALPEMHAQLEAAAPASLSLEEIVRNLDARSWARARALHQFEGTRTYTMHDHGFPSGYAEMVVEVQYKAPATKQFRIFSQSGSRLIVDHVFKPMLESERQGAADPERVEVTSRNYQSAIAGFERTPDGDRYVLKATPRTGDRFLFRGTVWVDARDFAVVRIEGKPAESPYADLSIEYQKYDTTAADPVAASDAAISSRTGSKGASP